MLVLQVLKAKGSFMKKALGKHGGNRAFSVVLVFVLASALCLPVAAFGDDGSSGVGGALAAAPRLTLGQTDDADKGTQAATASYRYARVMSDGYLYTTDSKGTVKGSYVWGNTKADVLSNLQKVDVLFIDSDVETLEDVKVEAATGSPYRDGKLAYGNGVFWTGSLVRSEPGLSN